MWFSAQREQCMYYLLQLGKKAYTYLHTSFAICRWVELTQLGRPKFLSYLCMPCFALRCLRSLSSSLTQNKWCVWWWLKCYLRELLLQLCCFCYENEPRWRLVRPSTSLSLGVYVYLCMYTYVPTYLYVLLWMGYESFFIRCKIWPFECKTCCLGSRCHKDLLTWWGVRNQLTITGWLAS